jgi:ABC-type ATPase with predicted acetyltransferase domain
MTNDILIERRQVPSNHAFSLLKEIYIERGTKDDWNLLHELHYKAEKIPVGPAFYRCVLRGQTIGVGMLTVSKMLSSGRNEVFAHLRPNRNGLDTRMMNQYRADWVNANMRTNSRLVLDTMYRGVGIAYRMQNLMCRMSSWRYIEFQSSMSRFNPFAQKAGFKFTRPKRSANYEKGVELFTRYIASNPNDYVAVMEEIEAMPEHVRENAVKGMREFYYRYSSMEKSGNARLNGTKRVDEMPIGALLKNLQQLIFACPLYGVYINPDFGLELPKRIPIVEFDEQGVSEPLKYKG